MGRRDFDSELWGSNARKNFPLACKVPYIPQTNREILMLPYAFTRYVNGKLPKVVLLKDRYGNIWNVKVAKIEGQIFFVDGWSIFVKQSFVEAGDILLFRYDGGRVFYVSLLGLDSCDKKGAGKLIHKVKDEDSYDKYEEHGVEINNSNKHHSSRHSNSHKRIGDSSDEEEKNATEGEQHLGKRKKPVDPFGMDLFDSGRARLPKNPYFVTQLRKKRQDELFIPAKTIRAHKLNLPNVIVLRDSAGREWEAEHSSWADGRRFYIGGWKHLCHVNLIGEEDFCICEIVKSANKNLYIQVQVVRGMNYA